MVSVDGSSIWRAAAVAQASLAAAALFVLAFAPPVHGRMLLVPIGGADVSPALLRESMLTPLAPGPLPGSVVVEGRGRELASAMFADGIVMLAAPAAICGAPDEGGSKA